MHAESSRHDDQESISFQHLQEITNSFSGERVLGRGGFGVVYKGVLSNGDMMAVKKLTVFIAGSEKSFENEVNNLMRVDHPNIVRLVGYCSGPKNIPVEHEGKYILADSAERFLCLEYMPNGSLDKHLADESCGLDWQKRYNIINGICNGLSYLHEEWQTNTPIVHLDLKPANILLDDNMVPKIADFGLSRLFGEDQTHACTKNLQGTHGYMAPEYINNGMIRTKSDIFSLGVIIIEIITGLREYPSSTETSKLHDFIKRILQKWRKRLEEASGYASQETCRQIERCLETGLSCVETEPIKRPVIREIIERISGLGSTSYPVGGEEISSMEFLVIHPRELHFCLDLNKRTRCFVQLTNKTEEYIQFDFEVKKTTNKYRIEPPRASLCPRSTSIVSVTMEERHELPLNDEFTVKSIVTKDMTDGTWHNAKLTVVYVPPAQQPSPLPVASKKTQASDGRERSLDQENMDLLIRCVCQDLGFSNGRPIAACNIYKCLLQWKLFEAGRTNVFDRIILSMFSAIKDQGNDKLAYWLSNSCTLLFLMPGLLKTTASHRFVPRRQKLLATIIHTIIARNQAFGDSHLIGGRGDLQQVEAKRPALVFKGHLTGFLEKVYVMIRDNLVKTISPLLGCCIKQPAIPQAPLNHWQSIVEILADYLSILKSNCVPSFLIRKMFTQVFSFIDIRLFNGLLLSWCCSSSDGEYVKAGLAKLEQWCTYETEEYVGSSWKELKHVRNVAIFLTVHEKKRRTLGEIICLLCPVLSIPQLYRFITTYRDGQHSSNDVSPLTKILSTMEISMTKYADNECSLLLLHGDFTSIPFCMDDLLKSMTEFELADVDMSPLVREK